MECEQLTHAIIGAAMEVHRALGPGFLKSIYRNALLHELRLRNMSTKAEIEVQVAYKDLIVGRHRLDMLVEDDVIIDFGEESLVWKRLIKKPRIARI